MAEEPPTVIENLEADGPRLVPFVVISVLVVAISCFRCCSAGFRQKRESAPASHAVNEVDYSYLRRHLLKKAGKEGKLRTWLDTPIRFGRGGWKRIANMDTHLTLLNNSLGGALFLCAYWVAVPIIVAVGVAHIGDKPFRVGRAIAFIPLSYMGMSMLPVNRLRVWTNAFSLSYERQLAYHRFLGRTCMTAILLHGLLALAEYGFDTILSMNDVPDGLGNRPPLFGFLAGCTVLILFPFTLEPVRRWSYELFYYSHHLVYPLLFFGVVHVGIQGLAFLLPGTLLHMIDRVQRHLRGIRKVTVLSATADDEEITHLELRVAGLRNWEGGAYVFLNVPEASFWQWHPISIACAPLTPADYAGGTVEPRVKLAIKNMGATTWSGRLNTLVKKHAAAGTTPTFGVDGAYGSLQVRLEECEQVVIAGGGIGVTPLLAVLEEVIATFGNIKKVTFIFVYRTPNVLAPFATQLAKAAADGRVSLHLYQTKGDVEAVAGEGLPTVKIGRPDWQTLVADAARGATAEPGLDNRRAMLLCGPEAMVHDARTAGLENGYDLHSETFFF